MNTKEERRTKQKLLSYYMTLADYGDKEAELMAMKIGKSLGFEDERHRSGCRKPVRVTERDGTIKEYKSIGAAAAGLSMSAHTVRKRLKAKVDASGRRYEFI